MPTYDPTGHPLLSDGAAALDPAVLAAHADAAEALWGLPDSGVDDTVGMLVVIHQINHAVEVGSTAAIQSESRGSRSVTYRDGDGVRSPQAAALMRGRTWTTAGSLR